jgi:hypothetical protein
VLAGGIFLCFVGSGHADPPVLATSGGALAYTENAPATAIDPGLTLTDADGDHIVAASVQITGNYAPGEDVLAYSPVGGITYGGGGDTITLTGDADAATYEAALQAVTYVNTSDDPSTATRTVTFTVSNTNSEGGSNTRDIAVSAVDDPLQLGTTAGSLAYTEGNGAVAADSNVAVVDPDSQIVGATVQITGNDASGEDVLGFANQLGITGGWNAGTGTLTLTGTTTAADYQTALRAVTYANTSDAPSTLPRTLTYAVNEAGPSASGHRVVAITAVNDPPGAGGDTTVAGSVLEDTPAPGGAVTLTVPALTDPDGPTPNQVRILTVSGGTLAQSDGSVIGLGGGGSLLSLIGGAVDLEYTPVANRDVNGSFTYVVVDGANPGINSASSVATVPITPVNDAPVLATSGGSASFVENGAPVAVDPGATVGDIDDANLEGATVQITGNYTTGEDTLSFAPQGGISGSWDASSGTMTLSGTATVAAYQAALRSVSYTNSSENPAAITRTVSFTVNDGTDPSPTHTRTVTVTAVNDAPTVAAGGGSVAYVENSAPITVAGGLTVADPDSANVTGAVVQFSAGYASGQDALVFTNQGGISGAWDAGSGTLTLSGTASVATYQGALRSVTYVDTADDPSTATRTITFTVDDDGAPPVASGGSTRDVTVTALNDPPVLNAGAGGITYTENDAPAAIAPSLTLADLDNLSLAGATVAVSANYWNEEDVLGFTDRSGISGSWDATSGTLTLSGAASVADYQDALQSVTYDDTSDDPSNVPRLVSFTVDDGAASSNTGWRTISVVPVNDPTTIATSGGAITFTEGDAPAAVDDTLTVTELDDPAVTRAEVHVTTGFHSGEDHLSVTTVAGVIAAWDGTTGTLDLSGAASAATYETILRTVVFSNDSEDPTAGDRTVEFRADDGSGDGPVATRTVAVVPVDDPPVARNDTATVLEGRAVVVDVLANDDDPDTQTVHIGSVQQPADAAVTIQFGKLRIVPHAAFAGDLHFDYTATAGGQDDTATVTVHVRPAADLDTSANVWPTATYTGSTFNAYATVDNAGPGRADGTRVVVDTDGAMVTRATTSGGSCTIAGDTARCSLPDVEKDGSAIVTVTARARTVGTRVVRATVSSSATDADPLDNAASAAIAVSAAPGFVVPPPTTAPPVVTPPPVVARPGVVPRRRTSGGSGRSGGSAPVVTAPGVATTTTTTTTEAAVPTSVSRHATTTTAPDATATSAPARANASHRPNDEPAKHESSPIGPAFVVAVAAAVSVLALRRLRGVR